MICGSLAIFAPTASAAVIVHGSTSITMDFVTVGDANNAADTRYDSNGFGSVDDTYGIGKYEVSVAQWNAVNGANTGDLLDYPASWNSNQPVAGISWYEAAMFTNWLTSGDVTLGVYAIDSSGVVTGIDRASAQSSYGTIYFLPTEGRMVQGRVLRQ